MSLVLGTAVPGMSELQRDADTARRAFKWVRMFLGLEGKFVSRLSFS